MENRRINIFKKISSESQNMSQLVAKLLKHLVGVYRDVTRRRRGSVFTRVTNVTVHLASGI